MLTGLTAETVQSRLLGDVPVSGKNTPKSVGGGQGEGRKARQTGLLVGLTSCVRRLISTLLAALPVYPALVNVSSSWAVGPLTFTQRSTRQGV